MEGVVESLVCWDQSGRLLLRYGFAQLRVYSGVL